jgi:hypothetical protein
MFDTFSPSAVNLEETDIEMRYLPSTAAGYITFLSSKLSITRLVEEHSKIDSNSVFWINRSLAFTIDTALAFTNLV